MTNIEKKEEVIQICMDILDYVEEIKETLDVMILSKNDDEPNGYDVIQEILFQTDYISDCLEGIYEKIILLQTDFTTSDIFFLKIATTMEISLDNRDLKSLVNQVDILQEYILN